MKFGVIKLISGEELISQYKVCSDNHVELTDPVVIHKQTTAIGPMLACSHWLLFNKQNTLKIKSDRIVALIPELEDNALRHYLLFVQSKDKSQLCCLVGMAFSAGSPDSIPDSQQHRQIPKPAA